MILVSVHDDSVAASSDFFWPFSKMPSLARHIVYYKHTTLQNLRLPKEVGGGVWWLREALQGQKPTARTWQTTLLEVLEELVYSVLGCDPCLFMCNGGLEMIISVIHNDVANSVCTGPESLGMAAITEIGNKLDIKQLGEAHVFLGLKIWRHDESIRLGQ
jgi:hypothetical protein